MKSSYFINFICTSIIVLASASARAELFDRGGGLIYDSDQDLTWMQNANVNGKMSVANATIWVENLEYGGFSDWRLPTTTQFDDPSCLEDNRGDISYGSIVFYERHADCTGGEMEYLTAVADPYNNPIFQNVANSRYWTSTPYRDGIDPCVEGGYCTKSPDNGVRKGFYWQWDFNRSIKATLAGGNTRYVWAVRDGDVDSVTEPPVEPPIEPPTENPDIAVGQMTTNIYLPALVDGNNNIWINFVYYGTTSEGENLWELEESGVNSPAIVDTNTGTASDNNIHAPSINYRGLISNQNISMDLVYFGTGENGESLWKIESYGVNQ